MKKTTGYMAIWMSLVPLVAPTEVETLVLIFKVPNTFHYRLKSTVCFLRCKTTIPMVVIAESDD